MLRISGRASRCFGSITGVIAKTSRPVYARKNSIFVTEQMNGGSIGYKACITSGKKGHFFHPDHIYDCHDMASLHEGDIVRMDSDGNIFVLWQQGSLQNVFMLTEACNCKCIMCPQPPREHSSQILQESYTILDLLKTENIEQICITGGEPTILGDDFITFLSRCITEHPEAYIDILTNGKNFTDRGFTEKVAQCATNHVCFCVSLHSDIDSVHDRLVGSKGSFVKTSQGIYNLAEYGCKIELRHVINKYNAKYLYTFSEHIYNYFPFCSHYTFMGMELYGIAAKNEDKIAISPMEYSQELCDAVVYLYRRGLPVSIYNIPLCLCRPEVRRFARQSISSWKNIYLDACNDCDMQQECAGFFSTSVTLPINHIKPIRRKA